MPRHRAKAEKVRESLVFYKRAAPNDPPLASCLGNCDCPSDAMNEASTAAYYVGTA